MNQLPGGRLRRVSFLPEGIEIGDSDSEFEQQHVETDQIDSQIEEDREVENPENLEASTVEEYLESYDFSSSSNDDDDSQPPPLEVDSDREFDSESDNENEPGASDNNTPPIFLQDFFKEWLSDVELNMSVLFQGSTVPLLSVCLTLVKIQVTSSLSNATMEKFVK